MKRFILLSLVAVGCAHAPAVETARVETVFAADSVTLIREAVRAELLAAASRPASEFNLALKLYGKPHYLGTIDFTGTAKTNAEATVAFSTTGDKLCGKVLLLQPTQPVYILAVNTSTGDATTTDSPKLTTDERVIQMMDLVDCYLSAVRVSSSGNLLVWELQ